MEFIPTDPMELGLIRLINVCSSKIFEMAQKKPIITPILGSTEARILEYCITNNIYYVTPSELSSLLGISYKHVWSSLNYLVKRGIATRIGRGQYQIDRDKAKVYLYLFLRMQCIKYRKHFIPVIT